MTALAREGQKILVVAVFTLHPGKTVVQVAAINITVNDLPEIGSEESIRPLNYIILFQKHTHKILPIRFICSGRAVRFVRMKSQAHTRRTRKQ